MPNATAATYDGITDTFHTKLRVAHVDFTPSVALAAGENVRIAKLPPGRIIIHPRLSFMTIGTFGSGRTLDIGYEATVTPDGTAIAASGDTIDDGRDVSSGAADYLGDGSNGADQIVLETRDGLNILAKVLGNTWPITANIAGEIVYSVE